MSHLMEASGAMHVVKEIPADDKQKLHAMSRVFLRSGMDIFDMMTFAENAYKMGRETEAKRHQAFAIGSMEDMERVAILRAMETCGHVPIKAAGILRIGRTTMYRKLKYFGIVSYAKSASEVKKYE